MPKVKRRPRDWEQEAVKVLRKAAMNLSREIYLREEFHSVRCDDGTRLDIIDRWFHDLGWMQELSDEISITLASAKEAEWERR